MGFKVVSLKFHGLNHPGKRPSMWQLACFLHANILCVQETHFQLSTTPKCNHKDFPHIFMASSSSMKWGVLIAVKNALSYTLRDSLLDPEGRFLILLCEISAKPFTLVYLYAPNSHQLCFFCKFFGKYHPLDMGPYCLWWFYPYCRWALHPPPLQKSRTRHMSSMFGDVAILLTRTSPLIHLSISSTHVLCLLLISTVATATDILLLHLWHLMVWPYCCLYISGREEYLYSCVLMAL